MKTLGNLMAASLMTLSLSTAAGAEPVLSATPAGGTQFSIQFGSPGMYLGYNTRPFTFYRPWTFSRPYYPPYGIYKPYAYSPYGNQSFRNPWQAPRGYRTPAPGIILQPGQTHRGGNSRQHRGFTAPRHRHPHHHRH